VGEHAGIISASLNSFWFVLLPTDKVCLGDHTHMYLKEICIPHFYIFLFNWLKKILVKYLFCLDIILCLQVFSFGSQSVFILIIIPSLLPNWIISDFFKKTYNCESKKGRE
jgi:hypothetical protein